MNVLLYVYCTDVRLMLLCFLNITCYLMLVPLGRVQAAHEFDVGVNQYNLHTEEGSISFVRDNVPH